MKILFFGGTGLIGSNFYQYCKNKNFNFDLISRNKPNFELRNKDRWIFFDILKNRKINLSKNYDIVIIGTTLSANERFKKKFNKGDFYKINNFGIGNILKHLKKINFKKLIFLSSGIVYGRYSKIKPKEDSEIKFFKKDKLNEYSISKKNAEEKVLSFCYKMNKDFLILRIFSLIDFRINESNFGYVINLFLQSAKKKNIINILGNPHNKISYLDINTFNSIFIKLFNRKYKNFTLNIGSDKAISILELAEIIAKIFKKKNKIKIKLSKSHRSETFYVPNIFKLKKKIKNFKPLSIEKICKKILIESNLIISK